MTIDYSALSDKSSFKSIFFLIVRERSHISAPSPRKIGRNRRLGFLILTLRLKIMCKSSNIVLNCQNVLTLYVNCPLQ